MSKNNYLASLQNIQTDEVLRIRKFPARFVEKSGALVHYNPEIHGAFNRGMEFSRQYSKTVIKDCGLAQGVWVNNLKVNNLLLNDGDTVRVGQVEFLYQENALFLAKEEHSAVVKQSADDKHAQGRRVAINLLLVCGVFVMTSFLTLIICLIVQEQFLSQRVKTVTSVKNLEEASVAGKQKEAAFFVPDAKKAPKASLAHNVPEELQSSSAGLEGSQPIEGNQPIDSNQSSSATQHGSSIDVESQVITHQDTTSQETRRQETTDQVADPLIITEPSESVNKTASRKENLRAPIDSESQATHAMTSSSSDSPFAAEVEPVKPSASLAASTANTSIAPKKSAHAELTQELEEGHPQAAKKLVREFDQRYLAGSGKAVLKEAKILIEEPSVAEAEKSALSNKVETFGALVDLYEKGNRLYRSGNKDGAFKSWLDFLKAEKNLLGEDKSQYAREVTGYAVKALLDRAAKLQAQQQQVEAFQLREAAAKIEIDVEGPAHQWVEQTLRKAQEQIKLAEQVESSNVEQAKRYWQNVLEMLPRDHAIAEQAHSKLSWYQYQSP